MKRFFSNNASRTKAAALCLLLLTTCLLLLLLFAAACGAKNDRDPQPSESGTALPFSPAEKDEEPAPAHSPAPDPAPAVDPSAYRDLVISKVYANGGNGNAACEHSFIELTNTGSSSLDLGALALYYRSGKMPAYEAFPLPDASLEGGGSYLIRGASSADRSHAYDASDEIIRIEACDAEWDIALNSREFCLLLAPAGLDLDTAAPPEELEDVISFFAASDAYHFDTGYVSDLSKNMLAVRTALLWDSGYYLQDLTKTTTEKLAQIVPAAKDGRRAAIVRSALDEVRFSHPAGFYADPFDLALTAPAGYGTIYYTTDGSDPASSRTRIRYEAPIPLSDTSAVPFGSTYETGLKYVRQIAAPKRKMLGAHVIKACAYDGERYTGVYTNSYFISPKMAEYGLTVMSVSLETKQMFGNPGFYHNFNPSSNEPNTRGAAFMEVFDENGIRRGYSNVELAASGHGSSGTGMRSIKVFYKASENTADGTDPSLRFDLFEGWAVNAKGQRITDFPRLLLRNSGNDCGVSYIRDAYMQRVSRTLSADTMAYAPVLLFINGNFWGIYNARERYSGDYVQSHYGVDKDNVALIESDYSQVHTNQNAPFIVTSGLEDDADDFNDLVKFIRRNPMDEAENFAYAEEKLDLDSLIDLFVSRLYFSALDFPGNNIKLWRNRAPDDPSGADNRWHFVMLDMDMGISFYKDANSTTATSNYFSWLGSDSTVASMVIHRLLANESFKNRFIARFYQVLNEVYVPSRLRDALDAVVAEREPALLLQSQRWAADRKVFESSVADMRRFVERRNKQVLRYLCAYFRIKEDEIKNLP